MATTSRSPDAIQFEHPSEELVYRILQEIDPDTEYRRQKVHPLGPGDRRDRRALACFWLPATKTYVGLTTCYVGVGPARSKQIRKRVQCARRMETSAEHVRRHGFRFVLIDGLMFKGLKANLPGAKSDLRSALNKVRLRIGDRKVRTMTQTDPFRTPAYIRTRHHLALAAAS